MSLISKIQSLISAANAVTGESRDDLTSAVQDLKDGYGGSTVEKGLVFSEYDSDGYPTRAEFVGMTAIPDFYCTRLQQEARGFLKLITVLSLADGITSIGRNAFEYWRAITAIDFPDNDITVGSTAFNACNKVTALHFKGNVVLNASCFDSFSDLLSVVFDKDVSSIPNNAFKSSSRCMLYDFSNATSIPSLYAVNALGHANGCVIKVPQSLLATWQAETNWSALTGVTWQGV